MTKNSPQMHTDQHRLRDEKISGKKQNPRTQGAISGSALHHNFGNYAFLTTKVTKCTKTGRSSARVYALVPTIHRGNPYMDMHSHERGNEGSSIKKSVCICVHLWLKRSFKFLER